MAFAVCEHQPVVRVITKARLRDFWTKHPQAKEPLIAWHKVAGHARWQSIVEVRAVYPQADAVGHLTVFNIGGNDFRLVTHIRYDWQKIFIKWIGTHAEYDKGKWKP